MPNMNHNILGELQSDIDLSAIQSMSSKYHTTIHQQFKVPLPIDYPSKTKHQSSTSTNKVPFAKTLWIFRT
jgi:hypothetical protein